MSELGMTHPIPTEPANDPDAPWWGEKALDHEGRGRFRIGSLSLWVRKHAREWWLAQELDSLGMQESGDAAHEPSTLPEKPPDSAKIERVAATSGGATVRLWPRLADRSVVSRPETPMSLPPRAAVDFFVTTSVWLTVESLEPSIQLLDVPTRLMSNTWFGPSSMEGELCYAVRTRARLELGDPSATPYRALSKVTVRNEGEGPLLIERINLPTRSLALFVDVRGCLWTPSITVARRRDGRLADVSFEHVPPEEAEGAQALAPAREPEQRSTYLGRALTALIG